MHGIHFTDPSALRQELIKIGLLDSIAKLDSVANNDPVAKINPVAKIDHAAAWVSDLARVRAFYERWFQATAGPTYSSSKRDFQSCFLSLGSGARLELMVSSAEPPRPAHLAVSVGSREAVDRLVQSMEAAGVSIISRPRITGDGYYEAVIADPEGNLLEITA
jgi:lactoylglutathione lyase